MEKFDDEKEETKPETEEKKETVGPPADPDIKGATDKVG